MAVVSSLQGDGLRGQQGPEGTVSSGVLFSLATLAWSLSDSRILLDNICVDNFLTVSGIDPASTIHVRHGYVERPITGSGITYDTSLPSNTLNATVQDTWESVIISGSLTPPPLENSAAAYCFENNSMYIFGGVTNEAISSDLWRFDFNSASWSKLITPVSPPPIRYHSMVYNSASGTLVVYGGLVASGTVSDLWSYSIANNTWSAMSFNGYPPAVRMEHGAAYDADFNDMYIWGGRNTAGTFFNELYKFSFADNTWRVVSTTNPGARCGGGLVYDPITKSLFTNNGYNSSYALVTEIYKYSIEANTWTQQQASYGTPLIARMGHTSVLDPGSRTVLIMGGRDATSMVMYDITFYNIDRNDLQGSYNTHLARFNHCVIFNTREGAMYIYGGRETSAGPVVNNFNKYVFVNRPVELGFSLKQTADDARFLTTAWAHLDSVSPTQTTDLMTAPYYAVSFDDNVSWKIYTTSGWYSIVQKNADNWQYKDNYGNWFNAAINTCSGAFVSSLASKNNQWTTTRFDWFKDTESTIPILSANDCSIGRYVALASSEYSALWSPWRGFNGLWGTNCWCHSSTPAGQWLEIDLGSENLAQFSHYRILTVNTTYAPKRFGMVASVDHSTWDVVSTTYSGVDLPQLANNIWSSWIPLSCSKPYRYYRLKCVSGYSGTSFYAKLAFKTTPVDLVSLTRPQWEGAGGFIPGTTQTIDMISAVDGVLSDLVNVTGYTAVYTTDDISSAELITSTWQASSSNPVSAQCAIKIKLVDSLVLGNDLEVFVSMDDGANYEEISDLQVLSMVDGYTYVVGRKNSLTPRGNNRMKLKVKINNWKTVYIYGTCFGIDY